MGVDYICVGCDNNIDVKKQPLTLVVNGRGGPEYLHRRSKATIQTGVESTEWRNERTDPSSCYSKYEDKLKKDPTRHPDTPILSTGIPPNGDIPAITRMMLEWYKILPEGMSK